MNKATQFNMLNRQAGEELPGEVSYYYDDNSGYVIEFHGKFDDLCQLPSRMDMAINSNILVGDARQVALHQNAKDYVAVYHAYALHTFKDTIPT